MTAAFPPLPSAQVFEYTSRYYRNCNPATRIGYVNRDDAQYVARSANNAMKPGQTIMYKGEPRIFVGYTTAKRDSRYHCYIPKALIRSENGDIFIPIHNIESF